MVGSVALIYRCGPDRWLDHSIDVEERLAQFGDETGPGLMFANLMGRIDKADHQQLLGQLRRPPRTGRFLPFSFYLAQDYSQLLVE